MISSIRSYFRFLTISSLAQVVACTHADDSGSEGCKTLDTPDDRCADITCGWQGTATFKENLGAACVFPFTYKGITYHSCTTMDHYRPWCSTVVDFKPNAGLWGNCDPNVCLQDQNRVQFPCSKVQTCCEGGFDPATDSYAPPVEYQATYIAGVWNETDRDAVMDELLALDSRNQDTGTRAMSNLKKMFLADMNPVELGFLLNDTRVAFVECNGIVTTNTVKGGPSFTEHAPGSPDQDAKENSAGSIAGGEAQRYLRHAQS